MPPTDDRECEIFSAALAHSEPAKRAAFLEEACGEDAALRHNIEALLRVYEASDGLLKEEDQGSINLFEVPIREGPGTRIGRYNFLERIGEGGFGVVYLAEQDEPVRRRVALKIIKLGMDTRAIVTRFEAERQALALMEHPNIAQVFDGGATDTGRRYFVMELVRGIPITRYCDEPRLSPEARLQRRLQWRAPCHRPDHRNLGPDRWHPSDGYPVPRRHSGSAAHDRARRIALRD